MLFVHCKFNTRALIFPPVLSCYRFLIHKTVQDFPTLCSFSIGEGDERRSVVCLKETVFRTILMDTGALPSLVGGTMGLHDGKTLKSVPTSSKTTGRSKTRRPDREVYVARGGQSRVGPTAAEQQQRETSPIPLVEARPGRCDLGSMEDGSSRLVGEEDEGKDCSAGWDGSIEAVLDVADLSRLSKTKHKKSKSKERKKKSSDVPGMLGDKRTSEGVEGVGEGGGVANSGKEKKKIRRSHSKEDKHLHKKSKHKKVSAETGEGGRLAGGVVQKGGEGVKDCVVEEREWVGEVREGENTANLTVTHDPLGLIHDSNSLNEQCLKPIDAVDASRSSETLHTYCCDMQLTEDYNRVSINKSTSGKEDKVGEEGEESRGFGNNFEGLQVQETLSHVDDVMTDVTSSEPLERQVEDSDSLKISVIETLQQQNLTNSDNQRAPHHDSSETNLCSSQGVQLGNIDSNESASKVTADALLANHRPVEIVTAANVLQTSAKVPIVLPASAEQRRLKIIAELNPSFTGQISAAVRDLCAVTNAPIGPESLLSSPVDQRTKAEDMALGVLEGNKEEIVAGGVQMEMEGVVMVAKQEGDTGEEVSQLQKLGGGTLEALRKGGVGVQEGVIGRKGGGGVVSSMITDLMLASLGDDLKALKQSVPAAAASGGTAASITVTVSSSVATTIATADTVDGVGEGGVERKAVEEAGREEGGEEEDECWDKKFNEDGDELRPGLMEELISAVGAVQVQKPQFDYYNYQPKDPDLSVEEYGHLIEIYDFSPELQTRDLLVTFKHFNEKGFDIKWVDDTHAIGVFSSAIAAKSAVLDFNHPLLKVRPIWLAARQTKMKAKKCTEFLLPYKERPVTVASVARNMVFSALGQAPRVSREKRDEERRKLREEKDRRLNVGRQKESAWDGTIGHCAMDTTDH